MDETVYCGIKKIICKAMSVSEDIVSHISQTKKGMTNQSFSFCVNNEKYIIRIPGEGTDHLINRREEAAVYTIVNEKQLCDEVIFIDPTSGYKITRFIENARVCNPFDDNDLRRCMEKLQKFHAMEFRVDHEFDIFSRIIFYESLWGNNHSIHRDYYQVKQAVLSLQPYISDHVEKKVLTHIDAVPDNFLIAGNEVRLIDWEYAGMQDPHVDIAMFCIYAMYDRQQIDHLIDIYFKEECGCSFDIRLKIYCYVAACGLLWSNWCEYKRMLGVEFGEYAEKQYQYAKEYSSFVIRELKKEGH